MRKIIIILIVLSLLHHTCVCEEPIDPIPQQPQDRNMTQTQTAMDTEPEGIMRQNQECFMPTHD